VTVNDRTVPWTPGDDARLLDGRYRLEDRLGGGAVADVFRAVDERLHRPVAVKLFRGDAAEELQRHEAEMRTLARLDHPSLVSVYDAGDDDGQPYLVMQLVEGDTLAHELARGPLAPDRVATYGAALADALAYVHAQGFIHRDVKPANVLIAGDGRVHLADFGIARLVDSAHVTRTGEVLGTPAYFAPEQVSGDPVGPAADIYALGVMLLECLTGKRPFEGSAMEVAMARLHRDPELPATLPGQWRDLLAVMTARDAEQRITASQAGDALRAIAAGEDIDRTVVIAPPPSPQATTVLPATAVVTQHAGATASYPVAGRPVAAPTRRPAGVWIAAVLVVVVAAVAIGIVLARQHNDAGPASYTPGTPTLKNQQLENDMQDLEKLVRR
jgi:eukaryotic-like serine/threonine-protein kinase